MVEENDHPQVYAQLANPVLLRESVFVVMLDSTAPWNFVGEVERWVKFIYELQRMAGVSITDLEIMAKEGTLILTQSKTFTRNTSRCIWMRAVN